MIKVVQVEGTQSRLTLLSFKFHKNPSCLKLSRTLLKNNDTLLEFRRTWRFLTGAGVIDQILDGFL